MCLIECKTNLKVIRKTGKALYRAVYLLKISEKLTICDLAVPFYENYENFLVSFYIMTKHHALPSDNIIMI